MCPPGQEFPILTGSYLSGDYCRGRDWALAPTDSGGWRVAEVALVDALISGAGEGVAGEAYLLVMGAGELRRALGRCGQESPESDMSSARASF